MRIAIALLVSSLAGPAAAQTSAASDMQDLATTSPTAVSMARPRPPWLTKQDSFLSLCEVEKSRTYLTFASSQLCAEAVKASAEHCDRALSADFAKFEGTAELESRKSYFEGVAVGCFTAQMTGRTTGKFVELIQLVAKSNRKN